MTQTKAKGTREQPWGFRAALAVVCLFSLLISAYSLTFKKDLHNDEYTTYIIANNPGPGGLSLNSPLHYLWSDPAKPYLDAMTVPVGGGFNYAKVIQNDRQDTLPPLHYLLLHTVCSFFPGQYSIWFGGAINLLFLLGSLLMLNKLLEALQLPKGGRLLALLLFGAMPGVQEMTQFLRMYTMAMFWVILLSYGHVKLFQSRSYSLRNAFWVGVPALLGVLTHYYFIVFAVFQAVVAGVWLLLTRRWKDTGLYVLTYGVAAGLCLLVFPGILQQLFHNFLVPSTMENLAAGEGMAQRLKGFSSVINTRLFGGYLPEFALALLIAALLALPGLRGPVASKALAALQRHMGWVGLLLPTVFYFAFITRIAFFANTRYMCFLYPLILCLSVAALWRLLAKMGGHGLQNALAALLCAVALLSAYRLYPIANREYTGNNTLGAIEAMEAHQELTAACITSAYWQADTTYEINKGLNGLVFLRPDDIARLPESIPAETPSFLLEVERTADQEATLAAVKAMYPKVQSSALLTECTWFMIYLLE